MVISNKKAFREVSAMRTKHKIGAVPVFLIILLASALLYGCGNAKKEAPESAATGVATVGFTECYKCHADAKNPVGLTPDPTIPSVPFGDTASIGWLDGVHSNSNDTPAFSAFSDSTCAACHDQLGDGRTIENFSLDTGIAVLGTADRPVVGCESCHGGGGNHFGLGPLPYPKSDGVMCAACHSASFPHTASNPEGGSIGEGFLASRHASSKNTHVTDYSGSTTDIAALCGRCHTDEGAKRYISLVNGTDSYAAINTALSAKSAVMDASTVQCRTCHVNVGHGPNKLLGEIANSGAFPVGASNEFKTCVSCHQLLKTDGTQLDNGYHAPYDKSGTTVNQYSSAEEIIADTHYDDPATTAQIEGYVINPAGTHSSAAGNTNRGACRDCHNPHNADTTINKQWARSAHGGEILEVKEAAANVYTAAVGAGGDAWQHNNWDDTSTRGSCQVCHTATGIANFLNNPAGYDLTGAGNNYSHLSGWASTGGSGQNEMLYCWGCHTDNVGGLRNPGPIPTVYTYTPTSAGGFPTTTVNVTFPEARKSNVCVRCHGGRGNNDTIRANVQDADFSLVDTVNRSTRAAEHHAPTAASVFAAQTHSGYEYAGQDYTGAPAHAGIDVDSAGRGPCVNCHLGGSTEPAASQKNHTFGATTHDVGGNITAIVHQTTCNTAACHNGGMSVSFVEGKKDGFADARAVLAALMDNSVANYLGLNISTTSNNNYKTVPINAYGALMNQLYFTEDPCAYVHNSPYARRLLFDSIDWMQDGDLDGTIDLTSYAAAAAFLNGAAPASAVTRP
jgi:hypothetical protein